jgi:hypothetical protein
MIFGTRNNAKGERAFLCRKPHRSFSGQATAGEARGARWRGARWASNALSRSGWARPTSGRSQDWLKFQNPAVPAVRREAEGDWGRAAGADGSASVSDRLLARVLSMCAPCLLEWLALAGLEPLPPSSHIQRLGFCSRVSSTRRYPHKKWGQSKTRTGHRRVHRPQWSKNSSRRSATRVDHG